MRRTGRRERRTIGIQCVVYALMVWGIACSSDGGTATIDVAGLRFALQPGTTGAGVPITVTVELVSAAGERVTTATNQVTLSATGATLGGTTTVAAVAGLATFNNVTLNSVGQGVQLTAHLDDFTATSNTFSVVAGPASASQSTMAATPPNPAANANVTLTFVMRDALGNAVTGAAATFSANAAGVTFTPPSGTTDANGGRTTVFRSQTSGAISITVNVAGTNVTLPVPVPVGSSAASLRFVTQPQTVSVAQPFTVAVEVLDNAGQRMTSATNQIALTISASVVQGTTTVNAIAGLATFSNLSVISPATGAVLTATSGLLTVPSNPFNVIANACVAGAMTLGTIVNATVTTGSGCTLNNHPAASFRFTIPAGNATVVTLGGSGIGGLPHELAFTSDPAGPDVISFVPTQVPAREWLLAPGTFLATVGSTTNLAGSFTFSTTNNGAGAPGCTLRSLVSVTATFTGQSLAATDCRDPSPAGTWYEDRYLIFDSRPCVITLSAAFDAYMELRETSLAVVVDDDDSGNGTDAQITRPTCRSGANPYVIAASSFNEIDTGPYTLTITFTGSAPELRATTMRDVFQGRVKR